MELYSVVLRGKGLEHKNRSLTQRQKRNMQISSMLFFNNGDYTAYARVVDPVADRVKVGKEYKMAAIVSVSKDELRKALEKEGVIRSLNSGF